MSMNYGVSKCRFIMVPMRFINQLINWQKLKSTSILEYLEMYNYRVYNNLF